MIIKRKDLLYGEDLYFTKEILICVNVLNYVKIPLLSRVQQNIESFK